MKFKLHNDKLPPINSIILVCQGTTHIIGIVEAIQNNDIIILLLDRIGRMTIDKNGNWVRLNVSDLNSLRDTYKVFINKNIGSLLDDSNSKFKKANNIE
jgi:hypothetical protein